MGTSKPQIAVRIREAREWREISQVAMAKKLDIARQTYLDLETGKTEPRITTLIKIAEITGRPLSWMIDQDPNSLPGGQSCDLSRLVKLFEQVPEPLRSKLLAHHIGLLSCFVEQMDVS